MTITTLSIDTNCAWLHERQDRNRERETQADRQTIRKRDRGRDNGVKV